MEKKISFIIPMYNTEKYIGRCLDSLINQDLSLDEYEILIIDDGSTDNSAAIVSSYKKRVSNIHYFYQENKGQSAARNKGIEEALGEYIWFVDADDFIREDCIKLLYEYSCINRLEVLTFNAERVSCNYPPMINSSDCKHGQIHKIIDGITYISKYNYRNEVWGFVVNRSYLKEKQFLFCEGRFLEDGIFTLDTIFQAHRISHYPIQLYFYFVNNQSTMSQNGNVHSLKMISDFRWIVNEFDSFIYKNNIIEYKQKLSRILTRKDSYLFFLLVRLIKSPLPYSQIIGTYNSLKKENHLPLQYFIGQDYNTSTFKMLTAIFNSPMLFKILIFCSRFKYRK